MKLIATTFFCLFIVGLQAQKKFQHPGILHTQESLDRMYAKVQKKSMPEYGAYLLLEKDSCAQFDYKMKGPFVALDSPNEPKWAHSSDFNAVYLNALMWVITKNELHAKKALEILEAYADSTTCIDNPQGALTAGWQGIKIINGAEILRYTYKGMTEKQIQKITNMLTKVFLPVLETFYSTKPYSNGNWGAAVTRSYISLAVFTNNEVMYKKAIDFYYNGNDNGTIKNYIDGPTGQLQESGRDQLHTAMGIGCMAQVCEIAYNQGDDLYGALDNRLLRGFEYNARYNLGDDNVPFFTWTDITGKYCTWTKMGSRSRKLYPVYELAYNHYVLRRGLAMPYTEKAIEKNRPEGYHNINLGFGTLLYYGNKGNKVP